MNWDIKADLEKCRKAIAGALLLQVQTARATSLWDTPALPKGAMCIKGWVPSASMAKWVLYRQGLG